MQHDVIVHDEVSSGDDLTARLIASGWATKPSDPLFGLDADERAMAKKLLERPSPPKPPTIVWLWHQNSLGRQWQVIRDGLLICRGFSEESLSGRLRQLKIDGYRIERGVDIVPVAA